MSWTTWIALAGAMVAGSMVAIQPGINGQLSKRLDSPFQAAVVSFTVGLLTLVVVCLVRGVAPYKLSALRGAPIWQVLGGGMVGSVFVTTALTVAPRIGAASFVALALAGQIVASLVLDHFGWIGFAKQPLNPYRVLGAVLLFAGVLLVSRN